MRKSTLFISAVLTTFMLAVLFGVASAYQNIIGSTQTAAVQSQPTVMAAVVSEPIAAVVPPTQIVNLAPEAAAALAGKILGRTDLYSVEVTQFEGADAYLVTFSSGDLVYLSMDGQVLSISKLAVTTIIQKGSKRNSGDNQSSAAVTVASNGDGEQEGGNEQEGGDD